MHGMGGKLLGPDSCTNESQVKKISVVLITGKNNKITNALRDQY
jgi:hypothetical protein